MTSANNRRVVSQRSLERQNSKGDDPWCLTCGVNLALDGRTYTVISRHNNSDLCDIFSRVLGAEFSEDYASVSVCNRCERQLRRLGRYNSIVLARHEGETLREQLEKNLSKHGQAVVESGHAEDVPLPTADTEAIAKGEIYPSSNIVDKRPGYEGHSSIRRPGKYPSRSVSSVHFEDKEDIGRRQAIVRKYSAPEGLRKRESLSPFGDAERRREARRRKWSSATSASEENTVVSPTLPSDRKLSLGNRAIALTSHQQRYAEMSNQTSIPSSDQQELPDQVTLTSSNILEEPTDGPFGVSPSEFNTEQQDMTSREGQEAEVDKTEQEDMTSREGQEAEVDKTEQQDMASCEGQEAESDKHLEQEGLTRMDTLQADDELFNTLDEEDQMKESAHDRESWNEADDDPSDFNADNRSNLSEVEERITTKTKFKGAYYNIGSTEDLLAEFANENDRERAMWSKLTYTESIDVGDVGSEPTRPPRRKSVKSLHKNKDGQIQDSAKGSEADGDRHEQIKEECESPDGYEADKHATGNDIKANGVLPEKHNDSSVRPGEEREDGKKVEQFDMESPEGTDSQTAQDASAPKTKTEKSPLIGKDGESSNQPVRTGSRLKKQMSGILCCTIL